MAKWEIFDVFPHDMKKRMHFQQMHFLTSHERGIDWLRWLNGRMVNGKLLMHFSMTWRQMHFLMSHEDALIG
jgi:hypothetical protein